ncbi:DNA-binding protein [Marinobacterium litorale]|uniref:DNA-binding protein n=1 Tax=Marinobacterium litorale TaxID=404770 RepID=UPI000421455E|nr:DNA-binding protein [Marinobacterium litorale]
MSKQRMKPFPIRPSTDVMEWLREKAKRNERPVNYVVNRILENAKRRDEEGLV